MGHLAHVKRVEESGKGRAYVYTKHYVLREEIKCCQGVCTGIDKHPVLYSTRCSMLGENLFLYFF